MKNVPLKCIKFKFKRAQLDKFIKMNAKAINIFHDICVVKRIINFNV